jgi:MoxR-like ATPase
MNLLDLDKNALVVLGKHLGVHLGDYARTKKADLVKQIDLARSQAEIDTGIAELVALGTFVDEDVAENDELAKAKLLVELLQSTKGNVDVEDVRKIVAEEIGKIKPNITQIEVVRPDLSTFKVEGYVRPEFKTMLLKASLGLNLMLVGPAGSGKTHLAHQVADALGREFASVSCTAGMSESTLQGWLLPVEGGAFEYLASDFVKMYENGGVFLFDEIDASDSNTLLFINQALANGSFNLPIRKDNSLVKRHPDFVCIACANTFGTGSNMQYAGRERLDESTLDRFRAGMIEIDYDTKFEQQVVHADVYSQCITVRKNIRNAKLNRVMSTRFMLDATKLVNAGESVSSVMDTFFIGWKTEEKMKALD